MLGEGDRGESAEAQSAASVSSRSPAAMRKRLGRRSPSSIPALVAVHTTRVRALVIAV